MKRQSPTLHKVIIAGLLAVCGIIPARAGSLITLAEINQAVKHFVTQQNVPLDDIQVTITSLNDELKLNRCREPLQISIAPGAKLLGQTSMAVSCNTPQQWKIHVAVHIDGQVNALVALNPITRGTVIRNADLKYSSQRYSQLHYGYYTSANQLGGMEAKRNIRAGQVITPGQLSAQKMVERGQHVTIVAESGRLNLHVKGKALMDGRQGQTIQVKNLSSQKLIYAQVVGVGRVKINF